MQPRNTWPKKPPQGIEINVNVKLSEQLAQNIVQGTRTTIMALARVLLPFLLTSYTPLPDSHYQPPADPLPQIEAIDQNRG